MLALLEFSLLALLLWLTWKIVRQPAAVSLYGLLAWLAAIVLAHLAGTLVLAASAALTGNLLMRFTLAAVVGSTAFWTLIVYALRPSRPMRRWGLSLLGRVLRLRQPFDRAISLAVAALLWVVVLVVLSVLGRLAAGGEAEPWLRQHSWLLRPFIASPDLPRTVDVGPTPNQALEHSMDEQARFFSRVRSSAQALRRQTGLEPYLDQVDALKSIIELSYEERLWLVQEYPQIKALTEHPRMRALAEDTEIQGLIDEIGSGSISAVYQLGDRRDLTELLADAEIRGLLAGMDMVAIMGQVEAHRRAVEKPMAVTWESKALISTTEVAAARREPGWQRHAALTHGATAVGTEVRFLLLRATIVDSSHRLLRLRVQTPAGVQAWCEGVPLRLLCRGDETTGILESPPGEHEWLVLLDARTAGKDATFQITIAETQ